MAYFAEILMAIGAILLIIEVMIFGFSTFFLFFVGLSLTLSGFLMSIDVLTSTVTTAIWANVLFTSILAAVLWKPLKKLQDTKSSDVVQTEFTEHSFVLTEDIDENTTDVTHSYSGISWAVKSKTPLMKGQKVTVVELSVGTMWVEAVKE